MTTAFGECLGIVAPYYNLALVLVLLILFVKLFRIPSKKTFMLPWKLLFAAVCIYILEEILTVFHIAGIMQIPRILNAWLEFGMITLFIYLLLRQQDYLKKGNQ